MWAVFLVFTSLWALGVDLAPVSGIVPTRYWGQQPFFSNLISHNVWFVFFMYMKHLFTLSSLGCHTIATV